MNIYAVTMIGMEVPPHAPRIAGTILYGLEVPTITDIATMMEILLPAVEEGTPPAAEGEVVAEEGTNSSSSLNLAFE
jgi:hypothetical protein